MLCRRLLLPRRKFMNRNPANRNPVRATLPVLFEAKVDHVVAIFNVGGTPAAPNSTNSTIGLRFESPEQMLWFFNQMIQKALIVWPDNEWMKLYMKD